MKNKGFKGEFVTRPLLRGRATVFHVASATGSKAGCTKWRLKTGENARL
jgi:hypothetical protein